MAASEEVVDEKGPLRLFPVESPVKWSILIPNVTSPRCFKSQSIPGVSFKGPLNRENQIKLNPDQAKPSVMARSV